MYNSLSRFPAIPYNIIKYLATQDEIIWKLLKYNSYDALSKPNLTLSEKMKLVWLEGKQDKYSVFMTPLCEDAIAESRCIMKIYNYIDEPNSLYNTTITYAFDFLYGGNMSLVEYDGAPVSRADLFIHRILWVLNGADVGGIGKMGWSKDFSRYDNATATIGNSKTFTGVRLFMSVNSGDGGRQTDCEG